MTVSRLETMNSRIAIAASLVFALERIRPTDTISVAKPLLLLPPFQPLDMLQDSLVPVYDQQLCCVRHIRRLVLHRKPHARFDVSFGIQKQIFVSACEASLIVGNQAPPLVGLQFNFETDPIIKDEFPQ